MATEMISPGMVIAGRYRVVRQLGDGGVGSVHLVQHVHTDERLALKVLHGETMVDKVIIDRFRTEARAPARIDSDHVVRVTDADVAAELKGAPFLVMEYLRGRDLGYEIEARGKLTPAEVVLYMRHAARALDKAHALGIVHRDLKPENLFLTLREDGTPWIKLVDFGIAKITGGATAALQSASKTRTGAIFGTPLYMAPEQARGMSAQIGPQTDVWALGLIANKLLTGMDYWTAESLTQLISQIAFEPIPLPSARGISFGAAYDGWFSRCCAREVEQRFRTAGEAVTALATALGVTEGPALSLQVAELVRTTGMLDAVLNESMIVGALAPRPASMSAAAAGDPAQRNVPAAHANTAMATSAGTLVRSSPGSIPAQRGGKTALAVAAVALAALLGGGIAFWALRAPPDAGVSTTDPAAEAANPAPAAAPPTPTPVAAPTPSPGAGAPDSSAAATADPPPVASAAAVEPPAAPPAPVKTNPARPPPTPATKTPTAKPATTKPPSDDDLLSGRH